MDHDIFSPVKQLAMIVILGISGGLTNIPWIAIGTFFGIILTGAYTIYKWKWSKKFNDLEWEIKQETLRQLKSKAIN